MYRTKFEIYWKILVTLRETEGRWDRYGETEKGLVTLRETERILERYGEIGRILDRYGEILDKI